jgi:hypothetical protein
MRIAWKTPTVIAVGIAGFLLLVLRPESLANVLFVIVGSILVALAITIVGSWPEGGPG